MHENTITRESRWFMWLVLVTVAGLGGVLVLYPQGAPDYWAWKVSDVRTAMLVGAVYFASGFFYVLLARQRHWWLVQTTLFSLFLVAAWLLVAAMVHWGDFYSYRIATLMWLNAYYLPLFAVPILNRQQAARFGAVERPDGPPMSSRWQTWLKLRSVVYGIAAVLMFVFAPAVAAAWPWPIEPVNVRMVSGHVAVFGMFHGFALGDGLWRRMRLFMVLTAMVATVDLVALVVAPTPYQWGTVMGVLFPLMLLEWLGTALFALKTEGQ